GRLPATQQQLSTQQGRRNIVLRRLCELFDGGVRLCPLTGPFVGINETTCDSNGVGTRGELLPPKLQGLVSFAARVVQLRAQQRNDVRIWVSRSRGLEGLHGRRPIASVTRQRLLAAHFSFDKPRPSGHAWLW